MSLFEYIRQGGPIMYILLTLNIVGFAIMISKFLVFNEEKKKLEQTADRLSDRVKSEAGNQDAGSIIELAKQEVSYEVNSLERGINTVKVIATVSPLLGLLGTVIGVLVAFRVMSQTGLNNPASFAQGISMALITTVGGMIVAIPHYIGHNYLLGMMDRLEVDLEKRILHKVL
ncbi:MAG: MotA/TolQ/ExbB proton channel family protein [Deltaproteobacteria bacterium]|nr:MAG: MotA/TolQ/ExbB proton channel family protein [Deltaproteobacteria bacterium]TNF25615.1 MAG: MotA/TolQ/ExbB proton channel family protein [Deltaproteobacteria bacterium]